MTEEKDLMTEEMFQCVGIDEQSSETLVRPSISYWQDAIRRLKKNSPLSLKMWNLHQQKIHLNRRHLLSRLLQRKKQLRMYLTTAASAKLLWHMQNSLSAIHMYMEETA